MNDVMREAAVTGRIPIYDLARVLPKASEVFYDDLHFNVGGARAAGRGLASFMIAQSVLSPSRAAP